MRSRTLRVVSVAVPGFLLGAFSLLAGPAWGATNDISASPHHLVLAQDGPPGRSTITWTTSAPGEVWASVNGGPRNLIARFSTSGRRSRQVDWIKPGYTVFSLHTGRTAQPQNHIPAGRLLDHTSVTTQAPPASTFGIAYWPGLETTSSTLGRRWPALAKTVAKDLDLIASMGAGVVRLVLWPTGNSATNDPAAWKITGGPGGDGVIQEVLTRQASNLVKLIKLCRDRGLKVTITFANTYLRPVNRGEDRQFEWQWAYPPEDGGWAAFLRDALRWVNGYVKPIETNSDPSVRSTVVVYDLQNETNAPVFPYLNYLYDHSAVPRGKRGVSVLAVAHETSALKASLGMRHLDYVEFHSYPGGSNPEVLTAYNTLLRGFPNSTVVLGEFGHATNGTCSDPSLEEGSQSQTVAGRILQARAAKIPYFVHWMLWNYVPPYSDHVSGLGYDAHCPKDAFGTVISLTSRLSNPDMEAVVDGKPQGWAAGATGPAEAFQYALRAQGSAEDAGATNRKYARVIVKTPPGRAWLRSRPISVKGGDGLWVNAYVRTNMRDVRLGVTQLRSDRSVVRTPGPAFTPTGFTWRNWLRRAGPWKLCLDPRAVKAIVTVSGVADSVGDAPVEARYYLDVDTVSASTRPRPAACT